MEDPIIEFFAGLPRQGPGGKTWTLRALAMLPDIPATASMADIGCGAGAQTCDLAEATGARIEAIDNCPVFLDRLKATAGERRLDHLITVTAADMADLPLTPGSLDLIWSEGAIYNIGFEVGLRAWRPVLRDKGSIALTECSWLTASPAPRMTSFWANAYPAMGTVDQNLERMRGAGYDPIGHFTLPADAWTTDYYEPMKPELAALAQSHGDDPAIASFIAGMREEMEMFVEFGDQFGYVFYLGQAA